MDSAIAAVLAGFALDCVLGDPEFSLHPVRLLGSCASRSESFWRRRLGLHAAGAMAWITVVGSASLVAFLLPRAAFRIHPLAGLCLDAFFVWASIAPRDLARHALRVRRVLLKGDLPGARLAVSNLVGRDTAGLDEAGVARACVESVAESSVDGVAAPLFWALVLGPWAAFAYRAVNTLDSMFGHKNERYLHFGRFSALADDAATFLPARIAALITVPCAALLGLDAKSALRVLARDRLKHESPNSGHPEAVFAGALGTRLGGMAVYGGESIDHPVMGDGNRPADPGMIGEAVALMYAQAIALLALGAVLRLGIAALLSAFAA
jgi:adenosylcobinamide-phosphate synthase